MKVNKNYKIIKIITNIFYINIKNAYEFIYIRNN